MKKSRGFTLIEVMAVVAIVGIIAALAYPAYMGYVRKANRSEAKVELADIAQRLQRCHTSVLRFDDKDNCPVYEDLSDTIETRGGAGFYKITISALGSESTKTAYILTAKAIRAPQTKDVGCEELTLTSTGISEPKECW
ncbi:MAG: type IV pilin protein [Cellvibrio sp.]|uniref:type IV pilin protein n=1 Tax=Cellvibrio sp. TaxID=1965322 RepID=UPI00319F7AA3